MCQPLLQETADTLIVGAIYFCVIPALNKDFGY